MKKSVDAAALSDPEMIAMAFSLWDDGQDSVAATSSQIFCRQALGPSLQPDVECQAMSRLLG